MSNLSAHRRPLATAAAAAGVLFALGFVPSAQATGEPETEPVTATAPETAAQAASTASAEAVRAAADPGVMAGPRLNPETAADGMPYVLGAVGVLGAGGLLAARARHARK